MVYKTPRAFCISQMKSKGGHPSLFPSLGFEPSHVSSSGLVNGFKQVVEYGHCASSS